MLLNWRGKSYEFETRTLEAGRDKDRQADLFNNIYGFDTESVLLPTMDYEPICFQLSSQDGEYLEYLPTRARGLDYFLERFVKLYSWREFDNTSCFMFGTNLLYDWEQLIKFYPDLLAMVRTGIGLNTDYTFYKGEFFAILRKGALFTGNAPHFSITVGLSKREQVEIKFRDTFSFFPSSLEKVAKTLKLEVGKMQRAEDLGRRDFRLEDMSEDKAYFEKYAKLDPKITRLAGEAIRDLHINAHMQRMRVSAPGFAINYLLHTIPEGTKIYNGIDDADMMQLILDTYAGGRTGGIYHGRVNDLSVIDFHSSYPASMCTLPSFGKHMDYIPFPEPEKLTANDLIEILEECHCFLRVSGVERDPLYPSLITNVKGKLTPVYGEFKNLPTTGVELYVGLKSGTLTVTQVHDLILLTEMKEPEILPFKEFAQAAYIRKQTAEKDGPEYISAKLVLNSCYGKLIESRTTTPVFDDVRFFDMPYEVGCETEYALAYYEEYIKTLAESSEQTWDDVYRESIPGIVEAIGAEKLSWTTFENLTLTKLNYGRYAIPAAASLITATSRARLIAAAKVTGAIYWDTDSLFIRDFDKDKVNEQLQKCRDLVPPFIQAPVIGDNLGDMGIEIEHASGYLAGVKRYFLANETYWNCEKKSGCRECPNKKKCSTKRAVHGIPTAPFDEAAQMIEKLATGTNNEYKGRARPLGAKEAKRPEDIGRFESKKYESKFNLDPRLSWERTPDGWTGTVKELETLKR